MNVFCFVVFLDLILPASFAKSEELNVTFRESKALARSGELGERRLARIHRNVRNVSAYLAGHVVMRRESEVESVACVTQLQTPDLTLLGGIGENSVHCRAADAGIFLMHRLVYHLCRRVIGHPVENLGNYALLQRVSFGHIFDTPSLLGFVIDNIIADFFQVVNSFFEKNRKFFHTYLKAFENEPEKRKERTVFSEVSPILCASGLTLNRSLFYNVL